MLKKITMDKIDETPIVFNSDQIIDGYQIKYIDLEEINQGSPMVGKLLINDEVVFEDLSFGGPNIYYEGRLYIPVFVRKFCVVGFRLAVITLDTLALTYISKVVSLIYLKEIKNNKIYFYKDVQKERVDSLEL